MGLYNGKRSYERADLAYALWFDTALPAWTLSEVLGTPGTLGWTSDTPDIESPYITYGTATGTPTVTLP